VTLFSQLLLGAAILLYLAGWVDSLRRKDVPEAAGPLDWLVQNRALLGALVCHTLFLFVHAAAVHRCPTTTSYEAVIFLCWCLALVYFFVNFSFSVPWLSKFVVPAILLLFIAALASMLSIDPAPALAEGGKGWRMKFHVVSLLGAYAFFLVSFIAGAGYLVKEKALKERRPEHRLPPLEKLDKINLRSLIIGFPLMTFGMFIGVLLAQANPKLGSWMLEKKVLFTYVSWLLYALVLHLRLVSSYRGRRVMVLTVTSFGFIVLGLLGTQWHYFK